MATNTRPDGRRGLVFHFVPSCWLLVSCSEGTVSDMRDASAFDGSAADAAGAARDVEASTTDAGAICAENPTGEPCSPGAECTWRGDPCWCFEQLGYWWCAQ